MVPQDYERKNKETRERRFDEVSKSGGSVKLRNLYTIPRLRMNERVSPRPLYTIVVRHLRIFAVNIRLFCLIILFLCVPVLDSFVQISRQRILDLSVSLSTSVENYKDINNHASVLVWRP
jgi:hypothetical protein